MRTELTGWVDYDRKYFPAMSLDERIELFEYRVRLVVLNPLRKILATQILGDAKSSALLIAGVSLLSAIEATGKFITGVEDGAGKPIPNNKRFKQFVSDYMSADLNDGKMGGVAFPTILWEHFRNGLAHGFAVRHGGFEGNTGQAYFVIKRDGNYESLAVNPSLLFEDFESGFGKYLIDLQPPSTKRAMFNEMFEAVFVRGE